MFGRNKKEERWAAHAATAAELAKIDEHLIEINSTLNKLVEKFSVVISRV